MQARIARQAPCSPERQPMGRPRSGLKALPFSPETGKTMDYEEPQRAHSPDKMGRSSFSSVRENDSELAQTFTASKVSSYNVPEDAIAEDPVVPTTMATAQLAPPLTQPHSKLHSCWYPAEGFTGWKEINVKGRFASKSFGDLQRLRMGWEPFQNPAATEPTPKPSVLERLPLEVFGLIIEHLVIDIPPNGIERRNVDLMAMLLTSKEINAKTVETVYRHVTIPHSRIFQKFLAQLSEHPFRGEWVRRLDFSHFNPSSLFSTAKERAQARNLTSQTLLQCLELVPNLQEFLAQEYIDDDLDTEVLKKLLLGLDKLQALDFCGCSSTPFKNAFSTASLWSWPETLGIKRLSLHKCRTVPSSVFEIILPKLKHLTHLDVAGTRITSKALMSIPHEAKITHLNLAVCKQLSAENVVDFLTDHPAVKNRLVFLSLATDVKTHDSLEVDDVHRVLRALPRTLKSLSLKGSRMESAHLQRLLPLTKHLEELALGQGLTAHDVDQLFIPDASLPVEELTAWKPCSLKYIDMTDFHSSDLSGLFQDSLLLTKRTIPLEVVEVSEEVFKKVKKSTGPLTKRGWRLSEVHVRSWLVRDVEVKDRDDGRRPWKMGAQFWGMRKLPVARAEVGGMYGSFMFGRNL